MRPRIVVTEVTYGNIARRELSVLIARLLLPLAYDVQASRCENGSSQIDTGK
jgi:hypothetical protein